MKLKKEITFIYTDGVEKQTGEPIALEALKRGYDVKFTDNIYEKCEIGVYCQHDCFPENSKFSVIMLHDMGQGHNRWPNIWERENWNKFDLGILPGEQWAKRWGESSMHYYAHPKNGVFKLGWPKADKIFKNKDKYLEECRKFKESLNLKYEKTILYAPSWEYGGRQDEFVQSLRKLPVNLLLKHAPWSNDYQFVLDNIEEMNKLHRNTYDNVKVIDPMTDIMLCIGISDLVVSEESSVMLEALLCDVPSIAVEDWMIPDMSPPRLPSIPFDFVSKCSKNNLKNAVITLLEDDNSSERVKELKGELISLFGETSVKVMDLIDCYVNALEIPKELLEYKAEPKYNIIPFMYY